MEYHVLSNFDIIKILVYGILAGLFPAICIFDNFARRDASKQERSKGLMRKVMPWIVLLLFISELSVFAYRATDYPWNLTPEPSQASMFREVNEIRVTRYGEPAIYPVWGWANDYQLDVLSAFSASILGLCWTIYAFHFKPSDTSWWKKTCKVIAYVILSAFIYAFSFHYYDELLVYAALLLVVYGLLWLAKAHTPKRKVVPVAEEEVTPLSLNHEGKPISTENDDPSRFMPHTERIKSEGEQGIDVLEVTIENKELAAEISDTELQTRDINQKEETFKEEVPQTSKPIEREKMITPADLMYCKYCGRRIEADSQFCKYCGKKLYN